MYLQRFVIITLLLFLIPCMLIAQVNKSTKGQDKFRSPYEDQTLSPTDNTHQLLPYNRWIDPAGIQIYFGNPELENHALDVALSPDQKWLAIEGRYEVVIVSAESRKIVASMPLSHCIKYQNVMNTFSGICWTQEGSRYHLFWSAVGNAPNSYVLKANWDGKVLSASDSYPFEALAPARSAIPNEVLVQKEGGRQFLYVVLNGNNSVVKMDLATKEKIWTTAVGVAPFAIAKANGKLYLTNWAGSIPGHNDANVGGVPWGSAKVDPNTGATREGTVTVLDPVTGAVLKEITVGLHPNDLIASHNQRFIYVANANSDEVCSISTTTDQITESISVRLSPEHNAYWGDSPNGLALAKDDQTLYVANGMDNALAVIELGQKSGSQSGEKCSHVKGFIPTGAYPGAISVSAENHLFVANIEAEGAKIPGPVKNSTKPSYTAHRMLASISVIPVPADDLLKAYTHRVEASSQFFRLALTAKLPRKQVEAVPVPDRIGEPSLFKHVLYIIKENRTYDQVLGDMKKGDGDADLTIFGQTVTPNSHQLCDQYLLLDNFYASGKCSAEGHQWTDASIVTDYVEKDVRAWIRSYPHVQQDALVYAPTGFIWDNALKNGKNVRIYGEASTPSYDRKHTWSSIYQGFMNHEKFEFTNHTTIQPVENLLSKNYPSYDDHKIPDILRAQTFIQELNDYEQMEGDQLPELMVMALPNDHTGGTRPGLPTPRAMVADNDLALGRIVEAVSKSRFWNNTVIFVTEDDSQDGWDHVSAYRTVGMVISPYSRTGAVVHTNYNQPSIVRTIEQILGLPPMNIMDATAMPMFDCFSAQADLSPYHSLGNQIPLDEMNPYLTALKGQALHFAEKSMEPQFDGIDSGNDDLFNRILWYAMKGKEKYPRRFSGKDDDDK
ncbi:MAG TPA: bifunctional YncE family protein/alkaline phosphatase family protein [Prolixibacteraceae bacterium]|jgi:DNA-binding beta-propeller fold protein YncE